MKTRHSKQVLVGLSVFFDGVLHFLQIKKMFYLFYRNYLVAFNNLYYCMAIVALHAFSISIFGPLSFRVEIDFYD